MRTAVLAGLTMVTALGAGGAQAQRIDYPGAPYPVPGAVPPPPVPGAVPPPAPVYRTPGYPGQTYPAPYPGQSYPGQPYPGGTSRWGGRIDGRWYAGGQAPGGWNAYRRPSRGYRVPDYWMGSGFYIGDYARYGLSVPPRGYAWHRYYDDAVLLDGHGRVYDSVGSVDWDRGGYGYDEYAPGYGYAEGYAGRYDGGYASSGYVSLPPIVHQGSVTTYQTGYFGYGGGTTVVTIQPSETVTTTTTTTEYVERARYAAPRRYVHRVVRPCGCARPVRHVVRRHVERPIQGS